MNLKTFLNAIRLINLPAYNEWKNADATAVLEYDGEREHLSIALYEYIQGENQKVGSAEFDVKNGHIQSTNSDFIEHWIEAVRSFQSYSAERG